MAENKSSRIPKYRCQKRKSFDRAFVELNGRRHYLGRYDSPESRKKYQQLIAEWLSNNRQTAADPDEITVVELVARFWAHVQAYYRRPDGTATYEPTNFRYALRPLKRLYGDLKVSEFGPRALKGVRQQMIDSRWCRSNINKQIGRIKMLFRWGVAEELVDPAVYQKLQAIPGLKRGRSEARESQPVKPVLAAHIDAIEPYVSKQVWTLVQLQLLTAARSGELVVMRTIDIDTSGTIWMYRPSQHKTAHRDHERTIYIGPAAQRIIRPFMVGRAVDDFMFSPQEAEKDRRAEIHEHRQTPLNCGNRPGSNRSKRPERPAGSRYTIYSYRRAIQRGCDQADAAAKKERNLLQDSERIIPQWHPHRLRHNAATNLRKEFGLEAARIILGHRTVEMTQLYAERDQSRALEVMSEVG